MLGGKLFEKVKELFISNQMKKVNPDEPLDKGLKLQKEVGDLKEKVDILKGNVRDRDTDIIGFEKSAKESKKQMEKFAMTLGVQNDYPTLLGEIEKLICVEDDVEILRGQMRKLKGDDKGEVDKAINLGEKAVGEMREKEVELKGEITQLKSKRNVDKYKPGELTKETIIILFQSILNWIRGLPKLVISKIKGVNNLWQL